MKRNKRVRINVKKVVKNISFLFIAIMIIVLATSNVAAKREFITKNITIDNSDTLWSIASNISSKDNNLNIQNVIYDIKEINGLENSDIYVGQVLQVPVY